MLQRYLLARRIPAGSQFQATILQADPDIFATGWIPMRRSVVHVPSPDSSESFGVEKNPGLPINRYPSIKIILSGHLQGVDDIARSLPTFHFRPVAIGKHRLKHLLNGIASMFSVE